MTDTHIAQHIVSVHQRQQQAVHPAYTTEQLQRYIKFARDFGPNFRMCRPNWCDAMSTEGKRQTAYRYALYHSVPTEAMVHFSEGLARRMVDEVTPMVKEAYKPLEEYCDGAV